MNFLWSAWTVLGVNFREVCTMFMNCLVANFLWSSNDSWTVLVANFLNCPDGEFPVKLERFLDCPGGEFPVNFERFLNFHGGEFPSKFERYSWTVLMVISCEVRNLVIMLLELKYWYPDIVVLEVLLLIAAIIPVFLWRFGLVKEVGACSPISFPIVRIF